ncbi:MULTISPECIES: LCP family protein [Streptomyces]|uniref:LCP family protein n=1 Tax=Streptomyces caniscabiei TaxID=2746961 RepID=A0ABU4MND9_9ACTN|nr:MULTISPECIES: LCP family protein [Streptomyces]MBE4740016.1 LCP family protein [Streptomyces caniscabiei]MBE4758906.1 LCP family protein [Streptomyces caniscabiei]MBE4769993.1 LCP family protein [Streptomyces caniscabiei]MBE4785138.1 LCP family protein [Streptomyces caniscabiei]MBE4797757.1 LCP family protein [Streptomyces caniscabiei]
MVRSDVRGDGGRPRVDEPGEQDGDLDPKDDASGSDGDAGARVPGQGGRGGRKRRDSGGDGDDDGGRGRAKAPGRPRRRRVLRWSATVLAVVILGTAGAGYLYYQHLNGNIKKEKLNLGDTKIAEPTPNAAGQTPLNILLIGSDARDTAENQKLGGARDTFDGPPLADVQMLLHLSADRTNMSVVSMPRDTLLPIPKCTDPDSGDVYDASTQAMTNDSLRRGGPGCTVATWQELTGIHIDHFMMVDFAGVVSMADAIGGVPVCVDANIYSHTSDGKGSGLKLEKGTTYIQGKQALQWLRTRYGFEDGSDIARAKAQHQYMNAMVRELRENATITNPNKLRKLAEQATDALTVDEGLGDVAKLYDLSTELRKVEPARITMTTMPYTYAGARVVPKEGDAEKLFRLVREDIALDGKDKKKTTTEEAASDDPAAAKDEIGVLVINGTMTSTLEPVPGRALSVSQLLVEDGFAKASSSTTTAVVEDKTVVRYPSAELEGDAQAVAKALGIPLGQVEKSTNVSGVTLVVGADWREGKTYEAEKEDDTTPESADALNGADKKACMEVNPAFTW